MSEKDFLSQFTDKGKVPESFKQEERKPVYKPKKPVNKALIIVLCVLLVAIGVGVYFIFFAPKIEMPDFEGKTKNDVAAWVKQQDIETSGIIFEDDYYFDYDEDTIISQSVEAGKKVKENVKITFVSSLGPDPDELISVPDLETMTKSEIQDWISEYKLTKTKVTSAYSEDVEEGNVISFAFTGCEEDTFTRSSTLKISVSKGAAPAGTIAVKDFVKGTYETVETWAKTNKVTVTKTEQYSDTVTAGLVISQSIESGKTMKEGETLTVVVSKGKAVKVIDLTGYLEEDASYWCSDNDLVVRTKVRYTGDDDDYGKVVKQSIDAGTTVASGESIELTISKGKLRLSSFTGTTKDDLRTWIKEANKYGADLSLGEAHYEISDDVKLGDIISIFYDGDEVDYYVSRGKKVLVKSGYTVASITDVAATFENFASLNEYQARDLCDAANLNYQVEYVKGVSGTNTIGNVKAILRADKTTPVLSNTYIIQDETIIIQVYDGLE